jgi:hypothetical protein
VGIVVLAKANFSGSGREVKHGLTNFAIVDFVCGEKEVEVGS